MYSMILAMHNIARWIVLILGITVIYRSFTSLAAHKEWTPLDARGGFFFTVSMDIQFILGLILYFFYSPLTRDALSQLGAPFRDDTQRFFALFHVLYMLLALAFTHLGNMLARRTMTVGVKHLRAASFFTLAMLCILFGMPWTRPILPGL
ncbi:MAG: hypothetical protein JW908_13055 [Anaerolineales bacterium]|nr:hypothetical protein [Anaerolineales bacterium]